MSPIRGRQPQQNGSRVVSPDLDNTLYKEKRQRNNEAVKKSRTKAKEKTTEMEKKVKELKVENETLEFKIQYVQKELASLKEMFINQAGRSRGVGIEPEALENLLQETDNDPRDQAVQRLVEWIEDPNQYR